MTDNSTNGQNGSSVFDLTSDFKGKNNAEFFAAVSKKLDAFDESSFNLQNGRTFKNYLRCAIGLMGEYGPIGFGVREAQAIISKDKKPSYWSHAFILYDFIPDDPNKILSTSDNAPKIWESTMDIKGDILNLEIVNGVSSRFLREYNQASFNNVLVHSVPNIAAVVFALNEEEVEKIRARASDSQTKNYEYDFSGLIGTWLAYLFDTKNEPNPLSTNNAVFCSAYCQMAYDAVNIKLAQGVSEKNTSPQSIWETLLNSPQSLIDSGFPVIGYYCIREPESVMYPEGTDEAAKFSLDDLVDNSKA